jgi:putative heme-binding domain-containing protein
MRLAAVQILLASCLLAAPSPFEGNEKVLETAKNFTGRGVQADDTPPTGPQEALQRFVTRPGLAVDLVAAEPALAQPIHASWDSRGRMWVVQYRQYPFPAGLKVVSYDQHLRAQFDKTPAPPPLGDKGADIISVLEDTDGDGRIDRQTDVLKGLNIVTASVVGAGRLWVLNPPYLLSYGLKDGLPAGDPRVELSGFGLEDTHSTATNLQWNVDGWLYGVNGSTTTGAVGVPGGPKTRWSGQCVWRFHPYRKKFEIYAEGGGNTYSLDIDAKGRVFTGTNYGATRGMHYEMGSYGVKNWGKHGPLTNPFAYGWFEHMRSQGDERRFPQAFVIYEGGRLGAEYEGKVIAPNSLANKAYLSRVIPTGSTFRTVDEQDFITSPDRWFRPVWTGVGPDGAVYLADWYDTRLSHVNPVDDWDKARGRLYRVRRADRPAGVPAFDLSTAHPDRLIDMLAHPNEWFRKQAVLEIGWRGLRDTVPALRRMLDAPHALEALWALDLLGEAGEPPVTHLDPYVRRWAWKIVAERGAAPSAEAIAAAATETHPEVRMQILATAKRLRAAGLPLLAETASTDDASGRIPLMAWWALESALSDDASRLKVLELVREGSLVHTPLFRDHLAARLGRRLAQGGQADGLADADRVLAACADKVAAERIIDGVLTALDAGELPPMPAALARAVRIRLEATGAAPFSLADLRAGKAESVKAALAAIGDHKLPVLRRAQAADALSRAGRAEALEPLLKILGQPGATPGKRAFLAAAVRYDDPRVPAAVLANYERGFAADLGLREDALRALSARAAWARLLVDAVDAGKVMSAHVSADQARLIAGHGDPALKSDVERLWKHLLITGVTPEKDREAARLRAVFRAGEGDPAKGRALFTARCGACHALKGEGGAVGPDLTGYERTSLDFWVMNLVYPSLEIREGYGTYLAKMKDGTVAAGILTRRDGGAIVLRDLAGGTTTLKEEAVASLEASPVSVMPEGLLAGLSDQEIRDLLAHLMR